jgi:hypothetical protein
MRTRNSREFFRKNAIEIKKEEIACEDENLLRHLIHHIYFVSNDENIKEDILWLCQLMDKDGENKYNETRLKKAQEEIAENVGI